MADIHFRTTDEQKAALFGLAIAEGTSVSALLRQAIDEIAIDSDVSEWV